jgi:hypothetical protein
VEAEMIELPASATVSDNTPTFICNYFYFTNLRLSIKREFGNNPKDVLSMPLADEHDFCIFLQKSRQTRQFVFHLRWIDPDTDTDSYRHRYSGQR